MWRRTVAQMGAPLHHLSAVGLDHPRRYPMPSGWSNCAHARSSDKSIAEVARELGIYDSSLGNWVRQSQIDRGEREGLTSDERARLGSWSVRTPGCGWSVNS